MKKLASCPHDAKICRARFHTRHEICKFQAGHEIAKLYARHEI